MSSDALFYQLSDDFERFDQTKRVPEYVVRRLKNEEGQSPTVGLGWDVILNKYDILPSYRRQIRHEIPGHEFDESVKTVLDTVVSSFRDSHQERFAARSTLFRLHLKEWNSGKCSPERKQQIFKEDQDWRAAMLQRFESHEQKYTYMTQSTRPRRPPARRHSSSPTRPSHPAHHSHNSHSDRKHRSGSFSHSRSDERERTSGGFFDASQHVPSSAFTRGLREPGPPVRHPGLDVSTAYGTTAPHVTPIQSTHRHTHDAARHSSRPSDDVGVERILYRVVRRD